MAFTSTALLTNEAKRRVADMWDTGKSYMVDYFAISSGGHDPTDPTIALAPDPDAIVMPGDPPIFGPEPIDSKERTSDYCPVFVCRLEPGEVVGILSCVALFATIVYSPVPGDPDVGIQFLYAVHNRPALIFTATDSAEFRINVFF